MRRMMSLYHRLAYLNIEYDIIIVADNNISCSKQSYSYYDNVKDNYDQATLIKSYIYVQCA